MERIEEDELKNINGGISGWAIAGIVAGGVLLAGIIDGIARPLKCN